MYQPKFQHSVLWHLIITHRFSEGVNFLHQKFPNLMYGLKKTYEVYDSTCMFFFKLNIACIQGAWRPHHSPLLQLVGIIAQSLGESIFINKSEKLIKFTTNIIIYLCLRGISFNQNYLANSALCQVYLKLYQ